MAHRRPPPATGPTVRRRFARPAPGIGPTGERRQAGLVVAFEAVHAFLLPPGRAAEAQVADDSYRPGFAAELLLEGVGWSQEAARAAGAATPLGRLRGRGPRRRRLLCHRHLPAQVSVRVEKHRPCFREADHLSSSVCSRVPRWGQGTAGMGAELPGGSKWPEAVRRLWSPRGAKADVSTRRARYGGCSAWILRRTRSKSSFDGNGRPPYQLLAGPGASSWTHGTC